MMNRVLRNVPWKKLLVAEEILTKFFQVLVTIDIECFNKPADLHVNGKMLKKTIYEQVPACHWLTICFQV